MKLRLVRRWEIGEFFFLSVAGTLLHFLYEWSGDNSFVAAFSAVNESTWEHLKLLFVPVLVFTLLQSICLGERFRCLWKIKFQAVILGMAFVVVFFYTYSGVLGRGVDWLNIASFYAGSLIVSAYSYDRYKKETRRCNEVIWIVLWIAIYGAFVIFTYLPPSLGIFRSPV